MTRDKKKQDFLDITLPYRLDSIDLLHLVVSMEINGTRPTEIRWDGHKCSDGFWTGYKNAVIESGIMHARAMLDFFGLKIGGNGKLTVRNNKARADDLVIEDFHVSSDRPLEVVSIEEILNLYAGPPIEAENAIAYILGIANKGIAHITLKDFNEPNDWKYLEITSRCIPAVTVAKFYNPLNCKPSFSSIYNKPRSERSYQNTQLTVM